MNRNLRLSIAAVAFAGVAGYALAQVTPLPLLTNFNANNDAIQVVVGGVGTAQSTYVHPAAITTTYGYAKVAQTEVSSAFTYTATNNVSFALFTGSQLTSGTVTVNFPPTPNDGQKFCLRSVSGVTSGATIAYGPAGPTFTTTPTAFTAATSYCYLYSASNTTWDPI